MANKTVVILTCEHASNNIPKEYSSFFQLDKRIPGRWIGEVAIKDLLEDHWGWDPGSLEMSNFLQKKLGCKLFTFNISRLILDANRSDWNKTLFTEISSKFNQKLKKETLDKFYYPFFNQVKEEIAKEIKQGNKVVHIDVHSFTPIYNGKERDVELGLLVQDDKRDEEVASIIKEKLKKDIPSLTVKFNEPYAAEGDCIITAYKYMFPQDKYISMIVEVNNKFFNKDKKMFNRICGSLVDSLETVKTQIK